MQLARNAADGLARVRGFQPDLILCDVGMPQVDGYEFARRIRADGALANPHLVALTDYAMPENQKRARVAGIHQHLTKPAPVEALRVVIALAVAER